VSHIAPQYDRARCDPAELDAYDRVIARSGPLPPGAEPGTEAGPYFGVLQHSPRLADGLSALGVAFRELAARPGGYATADFEWIDIVLAHDLGCTAVLCAHAPAAVAAGVRPEAIRAVHEDRDGDLADDERALAEAIRAVDRGTGDAGTIALLRERFGERGAVEYCALIGYIGLSARMTLAFGLPAPTGEQVDELLAGLGRS
jgi:AhpD family alkylhydroperoxidase